MKLKNIIHLLSISNENNFINFESAKLISDLKMKPIQESVIIRREAFTNLSEEAKETALLILETPSELLGILFTSKYNIFSKRQLRKFLCKRNGWDKKKTKSVLEELRMYSKEISEES